MKIIRVFLSLLLVLGLIAGSMVVYAESENAEIIKDTGVGGGSSVQAKKINSPSSSVTAPPEGGMTIRRKVYSAADLESDQSGLYWKWDASEQKLTLKGWKVSTSGWDMDPAGTEYILIDRLATVDIVGENDRAFIYSSKGLVITGKGELSRGIIKNDGRGDLFFNNAANIEANITNLTGNIAFNNSKTVEDTTIWAKYGDVEVYSSQITTRYIDAGNNLSIFDSVVFATDHANYNDLYASNVLSARDSVLIFNRLLGEYGDDLDSSVALFTYNIAVKISGRYYYYLDQYSLITQSKISNNFCLPHLSYHGIEGYAIPKSIKLTVNDGYYVDFNDTLRIDGKISGDVRYRTGDPESFDVSCPLAIFPGEKIPLTVRTVPYNAHITLQWEFSHPELISIDRNGVVTLLPEAGNHIGEVFTIKATSESYVFDSESFGVFISNSGNNEKLRLPSNLKTIEDGAFSGIDASEIYIPEGVEKIGSKIFGGCTGLKIIRMPDSAIEALSEDSFDGCDYIAFICESSDGAAKQYAIDHGIDYLIGKVK